MLLYIAIAVIAVVAALAGIVAMQPSAFRIERSTVVNAPQAAVFALVNDFHNWAAWSPWAKMDPAMKLSFEGPPAGKGAVYSWSGNNQVGQGRMTIMESRTDEFVSIKLEFQKPFAATNTAEFTFKPDGDKTDVIWSMTGHNTFMFKAFRLVMNMDKMVGGQFEQGLAQMKAAAEAAVKP
jgi:uncharacterized protein YndB with AHSA1/START domain